MRLQTNTGKGSEALLVRLLRLTTAGLLVMSLGATAEVAQEIRDFWTRNYERTRKITDVGGTLNQTFVADGAYEMYGKEGETYRWGDVYLIEGYCFDDRALIHPTDNDPTAVVVRRTRALLDYLKVLPGAPDLTALENEFNQAKSSAAGVDGYQRLCAIRRKIALSNPLLDFDKLVFVEHDPNIGGVMHMCDQYFGCFGNRGGGLFILEDCLSDNPRRVDVLANSTVEQGYYQGSSLEGGVFLSPELSYDGSTIYFAWARGGDNFKCVWDRDNTYHLFKVNVDGTGLVQLTDGEWNEFDPCVMPNGRITFISERRGGYGRCHGRKVPTYTLHSMRTDGSDIYRLSYHETNEWHPAVTNEGLLVYTRWDYVDRGSNEAHHMWICGPDGTDARAPHGNYDHPYTHWRSGVPESMYTMPVVNGKPGGGFNPGKGGSCLHPWGEWNVRPIPNTSSRYIATAGPHHGVAFGSLVHINTTIEDDGMMSQVRRVTPECTFPEGERAGATAREDLKDLPIGFHKRVKDYYQNGQYGTAWPLSEDFYLCNYRKNIILLDRFGNKVVLYTTTWDWEDYRVGFRPIDPLPLKPRKVPKQVAEKAYLGERENQPHTKAVITLQNIYDSYPFPFPEGTTIKWLRVVQFIPKTTPHDNQPQIGKYDMATARISLGIVPVEDDGSVYFEAPIKVPIYFQALDENRMAVQSMKSVTYVHAGEKLSCVGCHEKSFHGWYAPPPLPGSPTAFSRPPSKLREEFPGHFTDPTKGAIPFNYHLLAKPVLNMDYESAAGKGWHPDGGSRTVPGYCCSPRSALGKEYLEKFKNNQVSEEDFRRVIMWIDLNSNELGASVDEDKQRAGQVVWPRIDVDQDNVIPVEDHLPDPEDPLPTAHHWNPRLSPDSPVQTQGAIRVRFGTGGLEVTGPEGREYAVAIHSLDGRVRRAFSASGSRTVPTAGLPGGMHVVRVRSGEQVVSRVYGIVVE